MKEDVIPVKNNGRIKIDKNEIRCEKEINTMRSYADVVSGNNSIRVTNM